MVPRIVVTVAVPRQQAAPEVQERKNALYAHGVRRHGGEPIILDATAPDSERAAAFASMDGLLISGGADVDPARYGRTVEGATGMEPDRDALEASAFGAAVDRGVPVLGICRGFQAINVFLGGTLAQHVDGHQGPAFGTGEAARHGIRIEPGSWLAATLGTFDPGPVNTYHHQAIGAGDLARGLVASAWAAGPRGDLVEGFESADGRFIVGVQCHPERTESTPPAFERLWAAFVAACRSRLPATTGSSD